MDQDVLLVFENSFHQPRVHTATSIRFGAILIVTSCAGGFSSLGCIQDPIPSPTFFSRFIIQFGHLRLNAIDDLLAVAKEVTKARLPILV